ncbi:MAG: glucosamine inositolphosphorylceramide transferase family protein [Syntrophobacteraceae bacterium]
MRIYILNIIKSFSKRFLTFKNIWSISLYYGKTINNLSPCNNITIPILSSKSIKEKDVLGVADPFVIIHNKTQYLFFEVINRKSGKGDIGLACSYDFGKFTYRQIVLSEPFHLSYPYVFKHTNEYYMVPESGQANSIRLYRAHNFPCEWRFETEILHGNHYCDTSLFYFNNQWWLYTCLNHDTLLLFYSYRLYGPWKEHPKSPIVKGNTKIARPGGRVLLSDDGSIIRFTQDCATRYGRQVRAYRVSTLTNEAYEEEQLGQGPILKPGACRWNRAGMHHIDLVRDSHGGWLAFVDGYRIGLTRKF